jgi:anti-anti-sigma regulatory factor
MPDQPAAQPRQLNQKFLAAITQKDDVCYAKLSGVIDEDNQLTSLVDQIPSGTVVLNLAEIERINSCGVRDWVNWLGKIEKNGANVVLAECSPAIVAQINLVHNFTGGGAVKSFYAPFFCPACDLEKVLLIEAAEMAGQSPPKAPTCRCDECDGVMDFDDMEESYFAFLTSGRKLVENAKIDAVLNELSPSEGGKGERKIRSRVGITAVSGIGGGMPSSTSLPSVPSLPSMTRSATGAGSRPGSNPIAAAAHTPTFSVPGTGTGGSRPGFTGSRPSQSSFAPASSIEPPVTISPGKPKVAIIVVVVLLVVAIGLLAYVVLSGPSKPKVKVHEMPQTSIEVVAPPLA